MLAWISASGMMTVAMIEAGPTDLVCLQRMMHDMAALERRG